MWGGVLSAGDYLGNIRSTILSRRGGGPLDPISGKTLATQPENQSIRLRRKRGTKKKKKAQENPEKGEGGVERNFKAGGGLLPEKAPLYVVVQRGVLGGSRRKNKIIILRKVFL